MFCSDSHFNKSGKQTSRDGFSRATSMRVIKDAFPESKIYGSLSNSKILTNLDKK